jgi:hypothetical protein
MPIANEALPTSRQYNAKVDRMTVDDKGCVVFLQGRGAADIHYGHLATGYGNYNALYSLLLACWINGSAVIAKGRQIPFKPGDASNHFDLHSVEVGKFAESSY